MTVIRQFYEAVYEPVCNRLRTELPDNYTYHSLEHTLDVLDKTILIGEAERLSDDEMDLVKVAALFHDTGFLLRRKDHELASIEIFTEARIGYDFNARDIRTIEGCILSTRITQAPASKLENVICDADLDYLGRTDFVPIAELLYLELLTCGEIGSREQWNRIQYDFLMKQRFYTEYSIANRSALLSSNLELAKSMVSA